ncbi:DELLA protein RGA [Linum perenne]
MDIWQQILELHRDEIQIDDEEFIDYMEEEEEEDDDEVEEQQEEEEDPQFANFALLKHRYTTSNKYPETTPSCFDASQANRTVQPAATLSTDEIIKLAGARIIESSSLTSSSQNVDVFSILDNPFNAQCFSSSSLGIEGLGDVDANDVEVIEYLLASADNYGRGNSHRALGLLDLCDCSASETGTPVQRTAYYFSKALRQRIVNTMPLESMPEAYLNTAKNAVGYLHSRVPFPMASQLAAVQTIVENVGGEKRIHVVDLKIRSGLSIIALMQALWGRDDPPLELLRVTAVASDDAEERSVTEAGRRISNFADGMNIPFSFKVVKEDQSIGLHKAQLDLEPKEATVVYSEYAIGSLIANPSRLDAMMKFVRSLHPRLMVVIETEANHNSPDFGHRFLEALFTTAARFDCVAECMGGGEDGSPAAEARREVEAIYLNERIRNVVLAEGGDRSIRDVKLGVWRKYFGRCRMLEIQLSKVALNHAKLVVSMFPCATSCLVRVDKKSLFLGWKDTPLVFVSAWKFAGPKRKSIIIL